MTLNALLLILVTNFALAFCVKFYEYPIPIPASPPSNSHRSPRHFQNNLDDPAVQFFVNSDDGEYHFGYDTGGGGSYREEKRDPSNGSIYGRYGFIDPEGILRITEYVADDNGFRSTESKRVIFDTSDLQVIGPIPKPYNQQLYKTNKRTPAKQKHSFY